MTAISTRACYYELARSTDREPPVSSLISSKSEGLGKTALGIVKYAYDRSSQLIGVIWFAVSLSRSFVVDSITKRFCFAAGQKTNYYYCLLNRLSAIVE